MVSDAIAAKHDVLADRFKKELTTISPPAILLLRLREA